MWRRWMILLPWMLLLLCSVDGHLLLSAYSRRQLLLDSFISTTTSYPMLFAGHQGSFQQREKPAMIISHPFHYSHDWSGTNLSLLSLEQAADDQHHQDDHSSCWTMARWPDPILRSIAAPVVLSQYPPHVLQRVSQQLQATAEREHAVGLAAQQCGVNARMIYLRSCLTTTDDDDDEDGSSTDRSSVTMINPQILERSPEEEARVWTESCLVLPPTFTATVVRDAVVRVAYHDCDGHRHERTLRGEPARALQHEMDHDRGILVTDHVGLSEMENDIMRRIEQEGHAERMLRAYERY